MLLQGIRVLDLSRLLPGAYCTSLLQHEGADIVMIEAPAGNPLRGMPAAAALLDSLYAGKQRVTLDLRSEADRVAFVERVKHADVLVEGFRPGRMDRLRLGYPTLQGHNRALVYCAITGYGSTGGMASRAGHDLNYLARSGALSVMPKSDGLPVIPGLQIADLAGGMQAAFLIGAALVRRNTTGEGARVEVSMADVMRSWTALPRAARRAGLPSLGLSGEFPCYRVYQVADGWISVAALEGKFWANLCAALDRRDLLSQQFDASAIGEMETIFRSASRAAWMSRFDHQDVCVEPVLSLEESEPDGRLTDF